ncbi:hypothetical protein D3C87_12940 [compost metagenome]
MFTETIQFKHWTFEIPIKLNRKIYSNTLCGYSEFHVKEFRSFFRFSEDIFTPELKELLSRFGIDYKKDTLVKKLDETKGKEVFIINFQFLGGLHFDSKIEPEENSLTTELDYVPISDKTGIAFYQVEETIIGKHIIYAEILFRNS